MNKEIRHIAGLGKNQPTPSHLLHSTHIEMLQEALSAVGEYGEIHLVIEKGCLRFIVIEKSLDVLKWPAGQPKTLP
jgi:hypothetical protein